MGSIEKVRFETEAEWQKHLGKALELNYLPGLVDVGELLDCDALTEMAFSQINQVVINGLSEDLSDSLVKFPKKQLDLGSHTPQFL